LANQPVGLGQLVGQSSNQSIKTSTCWRDIPLMEFANYLPEPEQALRSAQ